MPRAKKGRRVPADEKAEQIICPNCGAKTGRKKTEEEAITAWERRIYTEEKGES
ncbi:hypothetical protein MUB35_05815 [Blautia sp. NSJ-175]|uniref:hypothetical protein n=1 Tax=Blautia sp. NSJ-175 TaxID=2931396 RepID=UPI001FD2EED0|nr:hypothetical protein [Blautia sp. NSJ-175]MCJ7844829.1 hypothetical protein [Blautia sp. NSJ-175]